MVQSLVRGCEMPQLIEQMHVVIVLIIAWPLARKVFGKSPEREKVDA